MLHFAFRKSMTCFIRLFTSFLVMGMLTQPAWARDKPVTITKLKPLYLKTSLSKAKKPRALIVAGQEYLPLAQGIQRRIEGFTGIKLSIVSDGEALKKLKALGNIIALGQYGNNKLLEHFYYRWYLVVDGMQTGAGGYVLETVHNPDTQGINLIVVGGGDCSGV